MAKKYVNENYIHNCGGKKVEIKTSLFEPQVVWNSNTSKWDFSLLIPSDTLGRLDSGDYELWIPFNVGNNIHTILSVSFTFVK